MNGRDEGSQRDTGVAREEEDRHLEGVDPAQRRRAARAAVIGVTMEYYDLGIYATAASTVFATVFFPGTSPGLATVQAIATFSVAYVVRPVSAFILGRIGDRVGRRRILFGCLLVMGIATLGIGLVPGYATVGWLAPVLLVLLRIGQGVGASAEFSGAALMSYEFAPRRRRGLYGSAAGVGASLGGVLGSIVMLVATSSLSPQQFLTWGWRVPFVASAVIVAYGLYLRATLPETPVHRTIVQRGDVTTSPMREILARWKRPASTIVLVAVANGGLAYFMQVFMISYATGQLDYPRSVVLTGLLLSNVTLAVLVPLFGLLVDRIGQRTILGFGLGASIVLSLLFGVLLRPDFTAGLWIALIVGNGVSAGAISAAVGSFFASQLPPRVRFTGTATGREVGNLLGSGAVPLLAAQLAYVGGGAVLPLAALFLGVALLGTVGLFLARPIEAVGVERAAPTAPAPDRPVPPAPVA